MITRANRKILYAVSRDDTPLGHAISEALAHIRKLEGMRSLRCKRCGHEWTPRSEKPPRNCPGCNSPYWDIPKRKFTREPKYRADGKRL